MSLNLWLTPYHYHELASVLGTFIFSCFRFDSFASSMPASIHSVFRCLLYLKTFVKSTSEQWRRRVVQTSQCPISYLTLLASITLLFLLSQYRAERTASLLLKAKRRRIRRVGHSFPCLFLAKRERAWGRLCGLFLCLLASSHAVHECLLPMLRTSCFVPRAMHPCYVHTVVLLLCLCRTALASILLPASRQRMATVVLHLCLPATP